jgi:hypothetical protein
VTDYSVCRRSAKGIRGEVWLHQLQYAPHKYHNRVPLSYFPSLDTEAPSTGSEVDKKFLTPFSKTN